jgi:hypothetical protein
MASQFDDSDFVDRDFHGPQPAFAGAAASLAGHPPTREELETRASEAQQKLAELKRAQEELERERATLEEARRRRVEFQTGREEMLQHLTRGVALLEQAEFNARRDAEQIGKTLVGLRESLLQVESVQEENWNQENWNIELTRGLATLENARMEWNSARLKWTQLNGQPLDAPSKKGAHPVSALMDKGSFWELCRVGLALTWPVAVVGLLALIVLVTFRLR